MSFKQKKTVSSSKFEQRGARKRTRWGPPAETSPSTSSPSTASDFKFVPQQQLYQPPARPAGPKCWNCGQMGHVKMQCPAGLIKKE